MKLAHWPWVAVALLAFLATTARAEMSIAQLYTLNCSGCHGVEGKGVPEKGIPDLNDAGRYVAIPSGREYLIKVPGLSQSTLDDATVARLLNYVLERFAANRLPAGYVPYSADEVTRFRGDKASDATTQSAAILAELKTKGLLRAD